MPEQILTVDDDLGTRELVTEIFCAAEIPGIYRKTLYRLADRFEIEFPWTPSAADKNGPPKDRDLL